MRVENHLGDKEPGGLENQVGGVENQVKEGEPTTQERVKPFV